MAGHSIGGENINAGNPLAVIAVSGGSGNNSHTLFGETIDEDHPLAVHDGSAVPGVTDHGALSGLADNDHPQYQLAANPLALPLILQAAVNHGEKLTIATWSELLTIAAAAFTETLLTVPPGAAILAVPVRVVTVIPTAATFTVGHPFSAARYVSAISTAAGTTDPGIKMAPDATSPINGGAAWSIRITPNAQPAAATGQVRVTVFYYLATPPTS